MTAFGAPLIDLEAALLRAHAELRLLARIAGERTTMPTRIALDEAIDAAHHLRTTSDTAQHRARAALDIHKTIPSRSTTAGAPA